MVLSLPSFPLNHIHQLTMDETKSNPDLPIELWLEILSYLPRAFILRMMGINRVFFNLALLEKYQEVRFINDDQRTLAIFEQLK